MFTRDSVTIITATTGHRFLNRCLKSIQDQTFPRREHLVVSDGLDHRDKDKVDQTIATLIEIRNGVSVLSLPYPTGKEGWCGHRIYAAMSLLANAEFVCFLDDDNWFEPDHIASLVEGIQADKAPWGFSLRKIFDAEGNFVAADNCESLGNLHPVFLNEADRLIDTNCYLLRREVAVACAPIWYRPALAIGGLPADRTVTQFLLRAFPNPHCTRRHTVNYTAGSNSNSVKPDYFVMGNRRMQQRYPNGLPCEVG
ncbi:MAG TPA: glycosyltransferase family A protein [Tepidisphaeraceae bacterium]